ncbi:hypothetical protein BJ912DRAFT_987042 [Pholiota molesta]|nr:hypothetical protein BJ912DRAFT_987042 [Pholiota molesta]
MLVMWAPRSYSRSLAHPVPLEVLLVRLARTDEVGLDAELTSHDVWVRMVFVLASARCVLARRMSCLQGGCCCAERWGSVRRASYSADVHDRLLPNYAICEQHRGRVGAVFASAGVQR